MILGIDASRNRSGGAVAHLRGLIESGDPRPFGVACVHLWVHDDLYESISRPPWLVVHLVEETRRSLAGQLWWQYAKLPRLARHFGVAAMFNTDAGSVCPFRVAATLSQDLLSFEPGEMERYPLTSRARWRLEALRVVQLHRLRRSTLAIFLTNHAREVLSRCVALPRSTVIPHGVDSCFRAVGAVPRHWPKRGPIRCLYVSNAAPYKHQWNVVAAVSRVRASLGIDLRLRLVGGGRGPALERLRKSIESFDPRREFVESTDFVPHGEIASEMAAADLFVFASSCENLPVTLLEAMASGLPICSSSRGPMPEVLGPEAVYFDPEEPGSIASALRSLVEDPTLREGVRRAALAISANYTWERCAERTWIELAKLARLAGRDVTTAARRH